MATCRIFFKRDSFHPKNDRKSIFIQISFVIEKKNCVTETRTLVDRPTETEQNVFTSFLSVKYMHVCHI